MARKTYDDKDLLVINSRFKEAFDVLVVKVGRTKLAKEIGYNTTRQLYNIFDGNSLVPMVALYYLSAKYNVSLDWLFHGSGTMFKSDELSAEDIKLENKKLTFELKHVQAKLILMAQRDKINSELNMLNEMPEDEHDQLEAAYIDDLVREKKELDDAEKDSSANVEKDQ